MESWSTCSEGAILVTTLGSICFRDKLKRLRDILLAYPGLNIICSTMQGFSFPHFVLLLIILHQVLAEMGNPVWTLRSSIENPVFHLAIIMMSCERSEIDCSGCKQD